MKSSLIIKIFLISKLIVICSLHAKEHSKNLSSKEFEKLSTSPEIYICDHFLSESECSHLRKIAQPSLKRSSVVNPGGSESLIDSRRSSLGMFISKEKQDSVVQKIQKRIAKVTGIPEKNGEDIQVLYYAVGAEYQPHYDYFDPSTPGGLIHYSRGGQRVATFMVYLNTPEKGGETVFPKARLKITPKTGRAVLFYNVDFKGQEDPMSFHGGAPVIAGEKWIMTRWIRENTFR